MSKSAVIVAVHPETKEVITINKNNLEFGTIRVDQIRVSKENGFLNKTKRSAFITGKLEDLKSENYKAGQILTGTIYRTESRTPLFEGQNPKINPTTKEVHLVDGAPIYFKDYYTENPNAQDILISGVKTSSTIEKLQLVV